MLIVVVFLCVWRLRADGHQQYYSYLPVRVIVLVELVIAVCARHDEQTAVLLGDILHGCPGRHYAVCRPKREVVQVLPFRYFTVNIVEGKPNSSPASGCSIPNNPKTRVKFPSTLLLFNNLKKFKQHTFDYV